MDLSCPCCGTKMQDSDAVKISRLGDWNRKSADVHLCGLCFRDYLLPVLREQSIGQQEMFDNQRWGPEFILVAVTAADEAWPSIMANNGDWLEDEDKEIFRAVGHEFAVNPSILALAAKWLDERAATKWLDEKSAGPFGDWGNEDNAFTDVWLARLDSDRATLIRKVVSRGKIES